MSENELTIPGGKLRLHVEASLGSGLRVAPSDQQAHYLLHVMRAKRGDRVNLFNGRDGEWSARIANVSKRSCSLDCERMRATAVEAAEQSGRLSVPQIRPPLGLEEVLSAWPTNRRLIFCDEHGDAPPIAAALSDEKDQPFALLTGPEGGFESNERDAI